MIEDMIAAMLAISGAYLAAGLLAGILIHARGLTRIDPATAGAGLAFRLLVTPGIVALWPVLLWRWRQAAVGRDTSGPLEHPLSQEGLRRAHGVVLPLSIVASLTVAAAAVTFRPDAPPAPPDAYRVIPESPPLEFAKYLGRLFPSIPGNVLIARSLDIRHGLLFSFTSRTPIPPTALYWSPTPVANGELPGEAVFVSMLWGPGNQWVPLPDPDMTLGGHLIVYSFKTHTVESVEAPKTVR